LFTVEKALRGKPSHYDAFLEHAKRVESNFNRDYVFQCDSASLEGRLVGDLRAPIRFLSIDGGHQLEHLRTDCRIALQFLHPQGIIAFDDFCAPQWPEVTEGIFEFLDQNPDYKIFAISRKKAYVASVEMMESYSAVLAASARLKHASINFTQLKGRDIPFVNENYRSILFQKANDIFGFGLLPVI
jgi:methyltransferase family protein